MASETPFSLSFTIPIKQPITCVLPKATLKNCTKLNGKHLCEKSMFQWRFERVSSVHFQALMMKKLSYKYCNKRTTTRDNHNVQSHDQEEINLNSTINANSGPHTLTDE